MINAEQVKTALSVLNVDNDADGATIKAAYINKLKELTASQDNIPYDVFLACLDSINTSMQVLINNGKANASRCDMFTFSLNTESGETSCTCGSKPNFNFDCWNPFEQDFSAFEFNYLSRNSTSRAIRYSEMACHYLPYQCLCRLIQIKQDNISIRNDNIPLDYYTNIPYALNDEVILSLVRTSLKGRSNNIDQMECGTTLKWRITTENERYPYSIELQSPSGLVLGELPTSFSACLAPLLQKNLICINIEVIEIDRRRDRGRYAKCSHMTVKLNVKCITEIPAETYFDCL